MQVDFHADAWKKCRPRFFASSWLLIRTPYAFPGDTLKRSLTANKNVLDIWNKTGMIEVIDSRTK